MEIVKLWYKLKGFFEEIVEIMVNVRKIFIWIVYDVRIYNSCCKEQGVNFIIIFILELVEFFMYFFNVRKCKF